MNMSRRTSIAIKADFVHFLNEAEMVFIPKGILWVKEGIVKMIGAEEDVISLLPKDITIKDYSGKLVFPGFIDGHVHAVQNQVIASYGKELLEWLENYTFPLEQKFEDPVFAKASIKFFLNQLLKKRNNYSSNFPQSPP